MMVSSGFLATLVTVALVITIVSPLLLLVLLINDWRQGRQW